jgi:hypothetical protein
MPSNDWPKVMNSSGSGCIHERCGQWAAGFFVYIVKRYFPIPTMIIFVKYFTRRLLLKPGGRVIPDLFLFFQSIIRNRQSAIECETPASL